MVPHDPKSDLPLGSNKSGSRARFGVNTIPNKNKVKVSVAVVLPYSMFKNRDYRRIISQSAMKLDGSTFEEMFDLSPYLEMVQPIPAPIEVLGKICDIVSFSPPPKKMHFKRYVSKGM